MSLNLNQTLQSKYPHLEISVLNLSDAMKDNDSKRIDSEYFKREYLEKLDLLKKGGCICISDIAEVTDGIHTSIDYSEDSGINLISATSPKENVFDLSRNVFISQDAHNKNPRTALKENDVIISTVGTIGNCAVVDKSILPANSDRHVGIIRITGDYSSYFLSTFLLTKYGRMQTFREATGNVQLNLFIYKLKQIKIPLFPLSFQQEIETLVKTSHKHLEESKALYAKAEALLYAELGLNPHNPLDFIEQKSSGSLNISVRTLKQSFLATGRLDSEYYQNKYDEIERVIKNYQYAKLGDLVDIKKSIEPGSEAYQENGIPFVRVSNFNKFGISFGDIYLNNDEFNDENLKPKAETILLSKDGSIGIAYCVKDDGEFITSSALLHLNVKMNKILPEYLTLILNSFLVKLQSERDSGGSIIAHWRISEIEQILIPILDISVQQKIENLIKQSFLLRKLSSELLETAKQKVETAIEQG